MEQKVLKILGLMIVILNNILILFEPMCKMFNVLVKMSIRTNFLWFFAHKEKQINI